MVEPDKQSASAAQSHLPPGPGARVMLLVAHPDDETVGAGARLPLLADPLIVLMTDGAPRAGSDARDAGCATFHEYAALRRRELERALALAGVAPGQIVGLDYPDQGASWVMAEAPWRVAKLMASFRPQVLLTHPYEGGHPDHDATAFVAHAATALLRTRLPFDAARPEIVEMACYHGARDDGVTTFQEFIPDPERPVSSITVSAEERAHKRQMLDAHTSQARTLASFRDDVERYRLAPNYDFSVPPHAGRLNYERFDWGMSGERWRGLARRALVALSGPSLAGPDLGSSPSNTPGASRSGC